MHFLKSWVLATKYRNIIWTLELVRRTLNNELISILSIISYVIK